VTEGASEQGQDVGGMSTRAPIPATTLRGRWLLLARTAWVIIATLALGFFIASIPGYVVQLGQAGPSVEAPAGLVFALDLVGVLASVTAALVCLSLASVLVWRKSDDRMVMFVSSYLLVYGIVLAGPLERLEDFYPAWPELAESVGQPLLFAIPTVALFVLFPDGRFVPRWTRWLILLSVPLTVPILSLPTSYSAAVIGIIVFGAMYAQI
jgi:hypothetical protein